jgi:hypothetical protein
LRYFAEDDFESQYYHFECREIEKNPETITHLNEGVSTISLALVAANFEATGGKVISSAPKRGKNFKPG